MSKSNACVAAATLNSLDQLKSLFSALSPSGSWHLLTSDLEVTGFVSGIPDLQSLERFDSGCVFSADCEIRWRRRNAEISVLFLGNAQPPEPFHQLSGPWQTRSLKAVLPGKSWRSGTEGWRDTRYPNSFSYPIQPDQLPVADIEEFVCQSTGRVQYTRLVKLRGES